MGKRSVAKVIVDLTGDDGRLEAARQRAAAALDHGRDWGELALRVQALEDAQAGRVKEDRLWTLNIDTGPHGEALPKRLVVTAFAGEGSYYWTEHPGAFVRASKHYADSVELPVLNDERLTGIPPLELEEVRRVLGASEGETTLAAAQRVTDTDGVELWRERVAFLDGRVKELQEELTKLRRSRAVERAGPPTPREAATGWDGPEVGE